MCSWNLGFNSDSSFFSVVLTSGLTGSGGFSLLCLPFVQPCWWKILIHWQLPFHLLHVSGYQILLFKFFINKFKCISSPLFITLTYFKKLKVKLQTCYICKFLDVNYAFYFNFFFLLPRAAPTADEDPRLGVESELQLLATATAMLDTSCTCDLHHLSQQHQILHPLRRRGVEPLPSWILVGFVSTVPQQNS